MSNQASKEEPRTNGPKLEPCPFCGGDAYFDRIGTPRASAIIRCGDCGCSMESSDEGENSGRTWNQREPVRTPEATVCPSCGGNDTYKPCAYPSEGKPGCLRDARRPVEPREFCAWVQDDDGNWDTDCANKFVLIDGTPEENNIDYCCYCGKNLPHWKPLTKGEPQ